MRRFLKPLIGKKLPGILFLAIQLALLFLPVFGVYENNIFSAVLVAVSSVVVIVCEINRESDSGFKLIWIAIIAVFPVFGMFLYFYVHADLIARYIRKKFGLISSQPSCVTHTGVDLETLRQTEKEEAGIIQYLNISANAPCFECSDTRYFPIGEDMFQSLMDDITKAHRSVFMEFFIINESDSMWQTLCTALRTLAHKGVDVRLIYDALGSYTSVGADFEKRLADDGIKCCPFSPLKPFLSTYHNNRDHRKIVIIDGAIAYTGGINIADEYINRKERFGHWKDTAIRTEGGAAAGFLQMYLRMWNFVLGQSSDCKAVPAPATVAKKAGYIVPFEDSPADNEYVTRNLYLSIINSARDYVYINTPYLIPDDALLQAMKFASARGVRVCICMPHIPDKKSVFALGRSYYPELIRCGVRIYEYKEGFLHAKSTVSDDVRAYVGSANYDFRSLYLHYECGAYIYKNDVIRDIKADYEATLERCIPFTIEDYRRLNLLYRAFGKTLRLFAALM